MYSINIFIKKRKERNYTKSEEKKLNQKKRKVIMRRKQKILLLLLLGMTVISYIVDYYIEFLYDRCQGHTLPTQLVEADLQQIRATSFLTLKTLSLENYSFTISDITQFKSFIEQIIKHLQPHRKDRLPIKCTYCI